MFLDNFETNTILLDPFRATSLLKSHPEFGHVDDIDRLSNPSSSRVCQYRPSNRDHIFVKCTENEKIRVR